jgi:hypothetical protein
MNDFEGLPPSAVAEAIVETLLGHNEVTSGDDVNVW